MSSQDQAEAKRRAERIGAIALLVLIPGALVAFAIDGIVLLERQDDYQRQATEHAARVGAAAAASVSAAAAAGVPMPVIPPFPSASASASASAPASSASAAGTAGKR
jgi:hypothetical protein